jgi:uncharacterized protein
VKDKIREQLSHYFRNKPVHRAYLFGSVVRNEENKDSDIDILVELDYANGADYFVFFDMQQQLNKLLEKKVDLVSARGLSSYIKPIIDSEKELIYERKNF